MHNTFMQQAIALAIENVKNGNGGPFGAIIVKNDSVIATGVNLVTATNDPTAHAEVVAIRNACRILGSYQLTDCQIYSSCEPCPMCFGAIYWARPTAVYFSCSAGDAAAIGFDDSFMYEELKIDHAQRTIPFISIHTEHDVKPFRLWQAKIDKIRY